MDTVSFAFSLFLLMDAVGNIPIFLSVLKGIDPKRQRLIILRELILVFFVVLGFYFAGDYVLEFLDISPAAVTISGAVILFIIGLKLVFPPQHKEVEATATKIEPFLVPLAIPLVAGPAVLAAVMLASHEMPFFQFLLGFSGAWLASGILLVSATTLKRILGDQGLAALERLTGLLLIMMAVQMGLSGIGQCFAHATLEAGSKVPPTENVRQ